MFFRNLKVKYFKTPDLMGLNDFIFESTFINTDTDLINCANRNLQIGGSSVILA
jgi:hypothetical protein